jgi:hypothetical protein
LLLNVLLVLVLRIRDVYRIPDPNFFHPGSRVKRFPDPHFASKNLSILTQKIVSTVPTFRFDADPDPGPLHCLISSVADSDPGSGAFLTPGSGIRDG